MELELARLLTEVATIGVAAFLAGRISGVFAERKRKRTILHNDAAAIARGKR